MDQSHDPGSRELHRILESYDPPRYVLKAAGAEICGGQDTPPHQFGDRAGRLYPCHHPAATWVSAAFLYDNVKQAAARPDVEAELLKAAAYFGIAGDVDRLRGLAKEAAARGIESLPDDAFALVFDVGGERQRHYPLRNPFEVKAAADYLDRFRGELRYDDRRTVARKILEKAAELGADLGDRRDMLERTAGLGCCGAEKAAAAVRLRRAAGMPADHRAQLEKQAALIEKNPDGWRYAETEKLAALLDAIDEEYGLRRYYGEGGLGFPEDALFAVTVKTAGDVAADLAGNPMTGNVYRRDDLSRLPLEALEKVAEGLGDSCSLAGCRVDGEKLAAVLSTLPRGEAERFDSVVRSYGVTPFASKQAAAPGGLSDADFAAAASAHRPRAGLGNLFG
jgi:hypothetical protein